MNSFKPGLVSKSSEVAQNASRLIAKLGYYFAQNPKIKQVNWKWFCDKHSGGLRTCYLALRRHNELRDNIVAIMENFGRDNYKMLLTDILS